MAAPGQTPPGWYPDPAGGSNQRYWDGKEWGPAAPGGPPAAYPAPAKKRGRGRGCLYMVLGAILLVVIIVIVAAVAASSGSGSKPGSGTSSHPAANDVSVSSCAVDSVGIPNAKGTIVNHSSGTSNYTFTISFLNSAGTVVAQGAGAESNIAPGQTVDFTAVGDNQASGALTCKVVDVSRFASG